MLRSAIEKHENESVLAKTLSQKLFSSSPPSQSTQKPINASVSSGFTNALQPASSSSLNALKTSRPHSTTAAGVKRTASGLAKAMNGAFDDGPGSVKNPISLGAASPVKSTVPEVTQSDLFDEDDFDSDIDLDIEEPSAKNAITYPTLPKQTTKPLFYPTLPKQQASHGFSRDASVADSGYGSLDVPPTDQAPASSLPLPWSSSPIEHRYPTQQMQPPPAQPRPSKRRTLPWLEGAEEPAPSESASKSLSKFRYDGQNTPQSKEPKKSMFPWNTTASAVKEQQKQFREKNKKLSKQIEGTEESVQKAKSNKKKNSVARVFLSEEQQHVLDMVAEQKKSVFFTGSAGTGKSVLLREIIATLRKKYAREPDRVAVTASTGLAACNVGGVTLHSFAGIGLGKEDVPELVRKIKRNQKAKHRWMRTKILIVDEISMVDGDLFDKLESIARQMRNNGRPFGGIQLVITGDFFQLPPVPDSGKIAKFAFDAATWNTAVEKTIGLHHVFRQKDPVFAGMLNEMREGRLTESSIKAFRSLSRPLNEMDSFTATELFPTRNEVERANNSRMDHLSGETVVYDARDGGTIVDKTARDKLLSNCMAAEMVTLKKGAQVMLIKNIDESLVNGSLGKVIGFMSEETFDSYSANEDQYMSSQNDGMLKDSSDVGTQTSRESQAAARLRDNLIGATTQKWPVVRFANVDGTSRDLLCQRESWKVELPNGEVQASRAQVPLILAWALSIHKAQGQTLERVKVDLGRIFEKGQAYVALSRATNMAGLQVLRFDPKKVNAHDKVRTFYQNLSRVEFEQKDKKPEKKKSGLSAEDYEKDFMEHEGW